MWMYCQCCESFCISSDPDAVVKDLAAQEPLITPAREEQVKKLVISKLMERG